jgi:SSS family solute:Na+ symporter
MTFAIMTVFSSGISMYALAKLLELVLNWNFNTSVVLSAVIVLVYIFLGGLTSAIYNEVLQFFLIVLGFLPLVLLGLKDVGGWAGMTAKLDPVATGAGYAPGAWSSAWRHLGSADANPMGVEWFGMVMGLGFVLSFGYWCTDFLVIQRAMAAESMTAARRTPLFAAIPKMLFPLLVIVPGMIAIALHTSRGGLLPLGADGTPNYNLAVPVLLAHYLPSGLLGLGLTALMASFMSGMAGNVTAFNTVWTYDIYQSYIRPGQSDAHYLRMGHAATVFGIVMSVAAAYATTRFNNIMDMLQLVFAFVNAPLFATFLLGMFWRRATGHGAFFGLLTGTAAAALHHGLTLPHGAMPGLKGAFLGTTLQTYPSEMAQNFWTAIVAWTTCFVATIVISLLTKGEKSDEDLKGLVYALTPRQRDQGLAWYQRPATLGVVVLGLTLVLNIIFW